MVARWEEDWDEKGEAEVMKYKLAVQKYSWM